MHSSDPTAAADPTLPNDTVPNDAVPNDAVAKGEGPRTRWGAIVWGMVFAVVAAAGLVAATSDVVSAALTDWAARIDLTVIVATGLLSLGAAVLLGGAVGLLRRAQVIAARRRAAP